MDMYKLPDVDSEILDFGLGKKTQLRSGIFALVGHASSIKDKPYIKLTKLEDCEVFKEPSSLADTCRDFFTYSSGIIYAVPIPSASSNVTFTQVAHPSDQNASKPNFTVSATGGNIYKPLEFTVSIDKEGKTSEAVFSVYYDDIKLDTQQVEENSDIEIEGLGVKIKFSSTSGSTYKKGTYVVMRGEPKLSITAQDINKAHSIIVGIDSYLEFIAYDFDSTRVSWQYVSEGLEAISAKHKREFFGVMRFRNLTNFGTETESDYLQALESERKVDFSSIRLLVLGQPVIYSNSRGKAVFQIPLGIFLGYLSAKPYYASLSEIDSGKGSLKGIVHLGTKFSLESIRRIAEMQYTGFRTIEGFKGVYVTEAHLLSPVNSDYDCVERIRVMLRAAHVLRLAYIGRFLNKNFNVASTKDDGFNVLLKEIGKNTFEESMTGSYSDYSLEVKGIDDILKTGLVEVVYSIVPLGKIKAIRNTFSFALPKSA